MIKNIFLRNIFYLVKPLFPRALQLQVRCFLAKKIRQKHKDTWPIDPMAATRPENWPGWPDNKKFALVLNHDVDTGLGQEQCRLLLDLEEKLGVKSTFYIVPERYPVSRPLLEEIKKRGFGLGVHGLNHDGKLFDSYKGFLRRSKKINEYLADWGVRGFSAPSMLHRLEWMHHLDIDYSTSTFDTDPFEPQPESAHTIFPFLVHNEAGKKPFLELPYTLPQDFTLFCILKEKTDEIWRTKLEWIVKNNGMALLNTHPDYMNFSENPSGSEQYSVGLYTEFIRYVQKHHSGDFINPLASELIAWFKLSVKEKTDE